MRGYWAFCVGLLAMAGVTRSQDPQCEGSVVRSSESGSTLRWTYVSSEDQCDPFRANDPGTAPNVFLTEKDCLSRCSTKYNELFPPGGAVCNLTKEAGPCLAHIIMWHYDTEKDLCDSFIWGGCQGNGNRFESWDECSAVCVTPKKGRSGGGSSNETPPPSQNDAGLIIGVVFGVVFGAAFLVTLTMYLLQRKKMKKQQHKRVPDTEMK